MHILRDRERIALKYGGSYGSQRSSLIRGSKLEFTGVAVTKGSGHYYARSFHSLNEPVCLNDRSSLAISTLHAGLVPKTVRQGSYW